MGVVGVVVGVGVGVGDVCVCVLNCCFNIPLSDPGPFKKSGVGISH